MMIDPLTGLDEDLVFGAEHRGRARSSSRLEVEAGLIATSCAAMEPVFYDKDERFFSEVHFTVPHLVHPVQGYTSVDFILEVPKRYPQEAPRIYPVRPTLPFDHRSHLYVDELDNNRTHICVWAEGEWTTNHSLAGAMIWAAIWINKYAVFKHEGTWPGPERPHCPKCGALLVNGCDHHPLEG
jgi:hypothetical protein